MLEADEGGAASVDDELTGVRRADADHQHDVDVDIGVEERRTLFFGGARERDNVSALEHRAEVAAIGGDGGLYYVLEVGAVGVDDVVLPIRRKEAFMGVEVALVSGGRVGALQSSEEIRQQIDEHQLPDRGWRRGTGESPGGQTGGMIAAHVLANKGGSVTRVAQNFLYKMGGEATVLR